MNDIVRSDGGQVATRGFLAQTLVCLLDMLRDQTWTEVTLEPNVDSEKVDILWRYADGTSKAVQVKSSENQISLASAKGWEEELIAWRTADQHELLLIGTCAQSVIDGWDGQQVQIQVQPLNFETLVDAAAQRLGEYLEGRNHPVGHRFAKILALAIVARLLQYSTDGTPTPRTRFETEFEGWTGHVMRERTEQYTDTLRDDLTRMLSAQFELVLSYVGVDINLLPSKYAPLVERATELIRWAERENRLRDLEDAIRRVLSRP